MSRYGIIFNVDRCIGCEACFVACKEENKVAPGIQWNKIRRIENVGKRVINYYRVSCQHCEDPACMKVCPAKAISKGPHGEVLVDHKKCIGCRMCLAACPYGAPLFNEDGRTGYFGDKEDARRLRVEGSRSPGAHQALHLPLRRGGNAAQGPLHLLEHGLQVRQAEVGFLTDVLF